MSRQREIHYSGSKMLLVKTYISPVINFRKIGVHVRKSVDHLVTTSARRTCRTQATNTFPSYS
jgi:hypothetical protein